MEVWLPVATKSQTCQEGVGAKSKEIYSGAAQPGRMVDSHLKAHPLSKSRTKASVQSSCSNLKYSALDPAGGCHSPHPGSLACSWLLFISDSILEFVCGTCTAMGILIARATRSHTPQRACKYTGECVTRWVRKRDRDRDRDRETVTSSWRQ